MTTYFIIGSYISFVYTKTINYYLSYIKQLSKLFPSPTHLFILKNKVDLKITC